VGAYGANPQRNNENIGLWFNCFSQRAGLFAKAIDERFSTEIIPTVSCGGSTVIFSSTGSF
jgi:hypothetical protein